MSKILTDNQYYHQIANIIREQNGTNNTYTPPQMVSALKDLFYEEVEGVPPLSFESNGMPLIDYKIDGASGGVGDLVTDSSDDNYGKYKVPVVCGGTTTNIYLDEPLGNVNGKKDYINFKFQKEIKKTKLIELTNSNNWKLESTHSFYYDVRLDDAIGTSLVVSNKVPSLATSVAATQSGGYSKNVWISSSKRINLWLTEIDHTLAALQNWLQQESLIVYYELQNYSEISTNLPEIPTIEGTNELTIDTTVQPSNVYVKSRHESQYETAMREDYEQELSDIESALQEV